MRQFKNVATINGKAYEGSHMFLMGAMLIAVGQFATDKGLTTDEAITEIDVLGNKGQASDEFFAVNDGEERKVPNMMARMIIDLEHSMLRTSGVATDATTVTMAELDALVEFKAKMDAEKAIKVRA
jgi:hypothetical protein